MPQPVQDPEPKPPTEAEQVAALLFRSAELIETHGWVTGKEQDALGRMCLIGAMKEATRQLFSNEDPAFPWRHAPIYKTAVNAMCKEVPRHQGFFYEGESQLTRWNDSSFLTQMFGKRAVQRRLRKVAHRVLAAS